MKAMQNNRSHAYCWTEWILLAFGLPGLIPGLSRLLTLVIPAAQRGPMEQRYLLSLLGFVVAEWLFVVAAWLFLGRRHESFREFFRRMGSPIWFAFSPRGCHLLASLAIGITAGTL